MNDKKSLSIDEKFRRNGLKRTIMSRNRRIQQKLRLENTSNLLNFTLQNQNQLAKLRAVMKPTVNSSVELKMIVDDMILVA